VETAFIATSTIRRNNMKNRDLAVSLIEGLSEEDTKLDLPSKDDIIKAAEKNVGNNFGDGTRDFSGILGWGSSIVSQKSSTDTKKASAARQAENIVKSCEKELDDAQKKFNDAPADSPNLKGLAAAIANIKKKYGSQLTNLYKQWGK